MSFKVISFTELSDHRPIEITIRSRSINTRNTKPLKFVCCPKRFIIIDERKSRFTDSQQTPEYNNIINDIVNTNFNDVSDLNQHITQTFVNTADDCFYETLAYKR